jgi:MFS family permease
MNRPEPEPVNPYAAPVPVALDHRPPAGPLSGFARYVVLAALCMVALIAYVQRNSIGVAEKAMSDEMGLNKHQMSWVISAFFLTYALLQLPTGWMAKVLGTRRALPAFVGLFSAAAGVFAVAGGLPTLLATRLCMGAAQSGIFPCAVNTITKWIPEKRRSFSTGMLGSFMSVGGAMGGALTGFLLPLIGWRWSFALYSIPGFLFAVWFYIWFRDRPSEHRAVTADELQLIRGKAIDDDSLPTDKPTTESPTTAPLTTDDDDAEPTPWRAILTSVPMWALCAQHVFRAAGYIFFASWFATFLRETRGVKDVEAGLLNSLPLIAVVVGSPVGGIISDWILARTGSRRWSRQGLAAVAMLACCALILLSYPINNAWLAVLVISVGSFFAAFGGPCAYTASIDIGGRHVTMVFSVMNMAGNIGAVAFPLAVPWLLREDPITGSGNWDLVLFTFAGMYFAAAVCWMLADTRKTITGD